MKVFFTLSQKIEGKKKQSEVKVDEKYILPDSPSQKIECRGRGLVFSWVDDLNNITI